LAISGLVSLLALGGCATGGYNYTPPSVPDLGANTKVIDRPREDVWKTSVPALGKEFFVINTIDKSSGLINLSYSGDPEKYIDCGQVSTHVKNARGERTYNFPGARAQQTYEFFSNNAIFVVQRKLNLEGRVNLTFEDAGPGKTKVTANTRYVVTRTGQAQNLAGGFPVNLSDTIAFNSNGSGSFGNGQGSTCVPSGKLEQEILSAVQ
jgi:hypothetical protein